MFLISQTGCKHTYAVNRVVVLSPFTTHTHSSRPGKKSAILKPSLHDCDHKILLSNSKSAAVCELA